MGKARSQNADTGAAAVHDGERTVVPAAHDAERLTAFCPTYAAVMEMLSRRWMGVVLRVLLAGPHRFNEILAAIPGISDPLLSQRLRELQGRSLVVRRVLPSSPVRVEYELTEAGRDLERTVRVISQWAERWWVANAKPQGEGVEAAAHARRSSLTRVRSRA